MKHKILERHFGPRNKFLLRNFLIDIRGIGIDLDFPDNRRHGEKRQKQRNPYQHHIWGCLLRAECIPQERQCDDIPRKRSRHHNDRRQQGNQGCQKNKFQRPDSFPIYVD